MTEMPLDFGDPRVLALLTADMQCRLLDACLQEPVVPITAILARRRARELRASLMVDLGCDLLPPSADATEILPF
jgi:hypothetical protein